jgi:phosphatidylserine/phosphatidylglycerophosphate/cardiolipin synthase-like enzyme
MPIVAAGQLPGKIRDLLLCALADSANFGDTWDAAGCEVLIVSPWIRDVQFPAIGKSSFAKEVPLHISPTGNHLTDIIKALRQSRARVRVVTLPGKKPGVSLGKDKAELLREAPLLLSLKNAGCFVETCPSLHAKIVGTKNGSIIGSANLTYNGLYNSREITFLMRSAPSDIDNHGLLRVLPELLIGSKPWKEPKYS